MNRFWIVLLILALLTAACANSGNDTLPPPPTQSAGSLVTAVSPGGADAGDSTELQITPQAPQVTASPTVVPTIAAPPTIAPLPTSTGVSTEAANDEGIISEFGDDRNPLTGELVSDPANLQRRPLAVKLSNAPAVYTRPQSGLNDADLVFEHTTEGNLTRFTAIIYGKTPPRLGPVRSARLIDIELPAMYDAA
ncbi:MAG: DUF3048 domain-containing protein, partial [Candidatus Promineifilaceae bacterium]